MRAPRVNHINNELKVTIKLRKAERKCRITTRDTDSSLILIKSTVRVQIYES